MPRKPTYTIQLIINVYSTNFEASSFYSLWEIFDKNLKHWPTWIERKNGMTEKQIHCLLHNGMTEKMEWQKNKSIVSYTM